MATGGVLLQGRTNLEETSHFFEFVGMARGCPGAGVEATPRVDALRAYTLSLPRVLVEKKLREQ